MKIFTLLFVILFMGALFVNAQDEPVFFGKDNSWSYRSGFDSTNIVKEASIIFTEEAPEIDGEIDEEEVWNNVPWNPAQYWKKGDDLVQEKPEANDIFFEWKGVWTEDAYYILIHVVDDKIVFIPEKVSLDWSGGWWNMDCIELYGLPDAAQTEANRMNQPNHWVKLFPDAEGENVIVNHQNWEDYEGEAAVEIEEDDDGLFHIYYEYKSMDWGDLLEDYEPEAGAQMRLAINLNEDDDDVDPEAPLRDHMLAWGDSTDAHDGGSVNWAIVNLVGPETQTIRSFTLVDPNDDTEIMLLENNSVVDIEKLGDKLNVVANATPDQFDDGKCKFSVWGPLTDAPKTEGVAPYLLYGDTSGDFIVPEVGWTAGDYVIKAEPTSEVGIELNVVFKVTDGGETAVSEFADNNNVKIYPAPFNSTLTIESKELVRGVTIYNLAGQALESFYNINSKQTNLNVSSLNEGLYFICVENQNGRLNTIKAVKR